MTLLIMAITIALFATIGTSGLIARTDARSTLAESARSVADELRRLSLNAQVSEVTIVKAGDQPVGIQFKSFGSQQQQNICQVVGRATTATTVSGEEKYTLDANGTLLAEWIYRLNPAGLCQQSPTDVVLYQGRLTSSKIRVMTFLLSLNSVETSCPWANCATAKQVRYRVNIEVTQTLSGASQTAEAAHPSLEIAGSLPIGLIQ